MTDEVYGEIDVLLELYPNWDGEDAEPPNEAVVTRTKQLIAILRENIPAECWRDPSVSPSVDGGVSLNWDDGDRWVMFIVQPEMALLECVTQLEGYEPKYQLITEDDALVRVLWALASTDISGRT